MIQLAWCLGVVFIALGLLHVYWGFGGNWGAAVSVPERNGQPLFVPGPIGTMLVGVLLFLAATLVLQHAGIGPHFLPLRLVNVGTYILAMAFLVRAVGDFCYIGFFKRVRNTRFAKLDFKLYSPVALILGLATTLVAHGGLR